MSGHSSGRVGGELCWPAISGDWDDLNVGPRALRLAHQAAALHALVFISGQSELQTGLSRWRKVTVTDMSWRAALSVVRLAKDHSGVTWFPTR